MKIHEYQAKEILRSFGVPVPESKIAFSVKEDEEAAAEIGLPVVVKAQIHAGGRGKVVELNLLQPHRMLLAMRTTF